MKISSVIYFLLCSTFCLHCQYVTKETKPTRLFFVPDNIKKAILKKYLSSFDNLEGANGVKVYQELKNLERQWHECYKKNNVAKHLDVLVEKKIKAFKEAHKIKKYALHAAIEKKCYLITYLLIQNGAYINEKNDDRYTPLKCAIVYESEFAFVSLLLDHGGQIGGRYNESPVHFAAASQNPSVLKYLIKERKHDLNVKDDRGRTPLWYAIGHDYYDSFYYLLKYGANVNIKDNDGETPLHYAADCCNPYFVERLLEKGASVDAESNSGQTPLHQVSGYCLNGMQYVYARVENIKKVIRILLDNGANLYVRDDDGMTPIDLAREYSIPEVIKFLEKESKF